MRIAAVYSHREADRLLKTEFSVYFDEIASVIRSIDAEKCRTKRSEEQTMLGQMLYDPSALNRAFRVEFLRLGWQPKRIAVKTPDLGIGLAHRGYREIDFIKSQIGLEVQFGKYAFLPHDIFGKMPMFRQLGEIKVGVEIVPMKNMALHMSTGIGHFEYILPDLYYIGPNSLDTPVLLLGVEPES